jgi:hypothetical protein
MTNEKLEEIKTIAFYQQAWGRFFYLRHEILRAEFTAKSRAEATFGKISESDSFTDFTEERTEAGWLQEAMEEIYIEYFVGGMRSELEALSKTLEPEKYLK